MVSEKMRIDPCNKIRRQTIMARKMICCLLVGCVLAVSGAYADPQINPGSTAPPVGQFAEKGSVTIFGTGFGSKNQAPPISWDNFESNSHGNDLSYPEVGPKWSFLTQAPNPSYSKLQAHAGLLSGVVQWKQYSISSFGWSSGPGAPYNELYLSFWRYHDPQVPGELPTNHKLLYFYGTYTSETPQFMIGAIMPTRPNWQYAVQNNPTTNFPWPASASKSFAETSQKWQRWEVYVKLDNPYSSSNGELKGWFDAQPTLDMKNVRLTGVDGLFKGFRLGHMYQGYHPGGTDKTFFDNVYIDRTQARVEIGNAPTWSACTHREIQVPTAWQQGVVGGMDSITVTVNQGSFPYGSAYLYVVDNSGAWNENGYPITFERSTSWLANIVNRWQDGKIDDDALHRAVYWYMKGTMPTGDPMAELTETAITDAIAIVGEE
jgi:hypothetical protein